MCPSGNESVQVSIVCLYLYCSWKSNYKGGNVYISLPGITVPQLCACPKPGPGFPTLFIIAFCVHWVKVMGDCSFCWCWWNCWSSHHFPFITIQMLWIWTEYFGGSFFMFMYTNNLPCLLRNVMQFKIYGVITSKGTHTRVWIWNPKERSQKSSSLIF
jgi:hypothetical protein